jgi:hypothetical protein
VPVEALHEHRMLGRCGVNLSARWKRFVRPGFVIPIPTGNPTPFWKPRRMLLETAGEVSLILRGPQVDADDLVCATDQMNVRVVEPRNEQPAARVDHTRSR